MSVPSNVEIQHQMTPVITALEKHGISFNTTETEFIGLGYLVEATLQQFGITEERFQLWFNLTGCNCAKRKKWMNKLFSWSNNKHK